MPASFRLTTAAAFLLVCTNAFAALPEPPALVQREANRWTESPAGMVANLDAPTSTTFTLFVPKGALVGDDGTTTLTLHFHGASWFMQQEHARRGAKHPLLVANAKEGDAVYETDIMQPGVLTSLLKQTEKHVGARIDAIELSGFSAGYAGVRGVLRTEEVEPLVAVVMLNDSVYVGDGPDSNPPDDRKPRTGPDGITPFIDFARKAAAGERTFLMEFSSTPSFRSAGPLDCARAMIAALEIPIEEVAENAIPASRSTADYQIAWRASAGNAHFWCYRAEERPIHLAHVRNQADMWLALEGRTADDLLPRMKPRAIRPPEPPPETTPIDIGIDGGVSLFVPANYKVPKDGAVELTIHFHGATWFVIEEHQRRGNGDPIVALELGQGSSVYRAPFEDPERLSALLEGVVKQLKERGAPDTTHIASLNITSFSAGYGAVREIVKSPLYVSMMKRLVLADSFYGSLDETALAEGRRLVAEEHVEVWQYVAERAAEGSLTFLLLTSDITPATYAGTHEVARAVAQSIDAGITSIAPNSIPAADASLAYPLHTRAQKGSFHWWGYGGEDAEVHMTVARRISDAWQALDQMGEP